jgi:hypothetical protein
MVNSVQEAYDFALQVVRAARHFGHEALPDGAQIFGRVPHVAPLAWLHRVYPPLQEHDIVSLEASLNRSIPHAYRTWLQRANGFSAFSEGFVLDGRRTDYSRSPAVVQPYDLRTANVTERLRDADRDAFFIGSVLEAEYLLYLLPATGVVYACGRRSAAPAASWRSLSAVVTSVMGSLESTFDGKGRSLRRLELRDLTRDILN